MGIMGLGKSPKRALSRVPMPPARMTSCFIAFLQILANGEFNGLVGT